MARITWNRNDFVSTFDGSNVTNVALATFSLGVSKPIWVTKIGFYLRAQQSAGRRIRLVIYKNDVLVSQSPAFLISSSWGLEEFSTNVRFGPDDRIQFGFAFLSGSSPVLAQTTDQIGLATDTDNAFVNYGYFETYYRQDTGGDPDPPRLPSTSFSGNGAPRSYVEYTSNVPPATPVITSPREDQLINGISVGVSATLPHVGQDADIDYSQSFQIRVSESVGNRVVYDQTITPSAAERTNGRFTREVSNLRAAVSYYVNVRHRDSWGVFSDFSTDRQFGTLTSSDPPELIAPLVKLDARSGFEYRMLYSHPQGVSAKAVQVELYNASGSTLLWSSGTVALGSAAESGTEFAVPATGGSQPTGSSGHPTLAWATGYSWRERVLDTQNVWSPWSSRGIFRTNATPVAPTGLLPENNERASGRVLSAIVSDPDGDPVRAAQVELVRVSTGQVVNGYPKAMAVSGNTATFSASQTDILQGAQYKFRVRATDGLPSGYGPYSGYNTFFYAISPVTELLSPAVRTNLVAQPSAEYEPNEEDPFWIVFNSDASGANSIVRERSEDTYFGAWRWVGTRTNTSVPSAYMHSKKIPVDQLERYLVQLMVKQLPTTPGEEASAENPFLPPTSSLMQVLYYDSVDADPDAFIGGSTPGSIRILGGDPEDSWTRYGGAIWPSDEGSNPRFTPGTTHVSIRITPVWNERFSGRVAFDAVMFEKMPDATTGAFAGQQYADSSFFGYSDPSTEGYGGSSGEWTAEEGNSPQNVRGVLVDATENHVMYSYFHPGGFELNAVRVIVQRWDVLLRAWRAHYDSSYLSPAATPTITLPDYLFANETRYRAQVICRDSAGVTGASRYSEFVSRYPGPPELPIYSYQDEPSRGTITIYFQTTQLDEGVFEGVQIARQSEDEEMKVIAVVRDPGAYQYTYHYPLSGKDYRFSVRQLSSVGPETLEGRWTHVNASVDYPGLNFAKNAHRPEEVVAFQHESGAGPNSARAAQSEGYIPWGSEVPVHLFSEARLRSDTTAFALYRPDLLQRQSPEERLRILKDWDRERPPVTLLLQQPEPEKVFVALSGEMRFQRRGELVYCEINWEATSFEEPSPDELEGIVDVLRLSDLRSGTI